MASCGKHAKKKLEKVAGLGVSSGDLDMIEDYLRTLRAENMAPRSIKLHRYYLERLAMTGGGGRSRMLNELTERDLVAWLANPDWSAETRKSARSIVRSFYAWAHRRGLVDDNPAAYLRPVRVPSGRPRPVPEVVVKEALLRCESNEQRLMVLLGSYAGLRVSEIAGLTCDALTPYGLRVMGKGSKERFVPLHPSIAGPLADHIAGQRSVWVFPSPVRDGHVGYDYIYKRIKAAIGDTYTPHQLRHRFATQAYKGTKDLRAVQELLGHSSPNTTVRYTLVEDDALTAAVASVA